jgi:hypothetical protein
MAACGGAMAVRRKLAISHCLLQSSSSVLVAIYPFGRRPGAEFPPSVFLVGCMVATLGMGVLRINSRLFAWLRNERRDWAASLATRH